MDRKSAYKAKSKTGALDRAARQVRADNKRKTDRADLLMTKRGLSDLTNQKNAQREKEKPATLNETDASKKRREELEKWLKKKEEQKKKDALKQKKPFYAGSVQAIGKFGYSVQPHSCVHGSKADRGGRGGERETTAPAPPPSKPATGGRNKLPTAPPPNRRPTTRAQSKANGSNKPVAVPNKQGPSSKPVSASSNIATRGSRPRSGTNTATVVKGKAPTRKVPTQQTVTKATEKQKVTAGSGKKRLQKGGNAARMDASNISTADLPWVTGATLPLDETAFPPADFGGCFTKEFNSPFQFGRRSSGRSRPQAKKTFEAAGFQFTFEAKAVFNKERAPYDPSQSLVTVMRGEPDTSPSCEFSFVPAADLLTSPELSSASGKESDLVPKEKDEEERPCEKEACSIRKPILNTNTPSIHVTCVVTPSKSVGRYSTRSKLEMSHKADVLCHPIEQCTEGEGLRSVVRRSIFDDSLEVDETVDDVSTHSARLFEFQGQHQREVARLEEKCSIWEEKMGQLQQIAEQEEEDPTRYEEAVDLVRMTVCMTRLLVKEKLKQFSDLCFRAKDVNAAKPVKLDDLQAFWDMVQLQVDGLYSKFAHLEKLEQNSWHPVATERTNSKRKKGGKKAASKARKSASSAAAVSGDNVSEKSSSQAGRKRESARLKLKEMKEAAKRAKSSRGGDGDLNDVMVMFPGMNVADSGEDEGVFKAPPSVVPSAGGGPATMQVKTPLQVGQQGTRTRGNSLRRSTRRSKMVDPAEFGYNFSQFLDFTNLSQPKKDPHPFIQTNCQPINDTGINVANGACSEVPENIDLTFYTTRACTPPSLDATSLGMPLGAGGGPNDSLEFLKESEETGTESAPSCPVGNLIMFTPTPKANRRKSRSGPAAVSRRRGSIKMYSQISPRAYLLRSKNHLFEQEVDMLMSPVRRSSRILVTPSSSARKISRSRMEVVDLNDLPVNSRIGLVPNSNLLLS